jgi:hypothetical protein
VKAGILDERDEDLGAHILADPTLTDKQKRALLEVYHSFRRKGAPPADQPEPPVDTTDAGGTEETD